MKKSRDKARETALDILNRRDDSQLPLDIILDDVFSVGHHSKLDKTFIYSLVYGVLRWRGRLDWIIQQFSHVHTDKIDPIVFNILRLGLFQIIYLSRVPVSAAVNTSVELAKHVSTNRAVKYVNAVLRKASLEYDSVNYPDFQKDPVSSIAASCAFPKWIVKRWVARLGSIETRTLCEALNLVPPITVRTNGLKTERENLIKALTEEAIDVRPTPFCPDGVSFRRPKLPIGNLNAYHKGWFQVQDEGAQLVSLLLDPQPGETILDACAGLGGKTGHMAQLMSNQGRIIALDHQKNKLSKLRSEMMHLGISIVTTNTHDLSVPFDKNPSRKFDRVLLDAPCTGLGVLRRNPDTKWVRSKQNLAEFQKRQIAFLHNVSSLVKPGGFLQYVVCSIEPEETDHVVDQFIQNHPEFYIDSSNEALPVGVRSFVDHRGFFSTISHMNTMDGFFAVKFKRIS